MYSTCRNVSLTFHACLLHMWGDEGTFSCTYVCSFQLLLLYNVVVYYIHYNTVTCMHTKFLSCMYSIIYTIYVYQQYNNTIICNNIRNMYLYSIISYKFYSGYVCSYSSFSVIHRMVCSSLSLIANCCSCTEVPQEVGSG